MELNSTAVRRSRRKALAAAVVAAGLVAAPATAAFAKAPTNEPGWRTTTKTLKPSVDMPYEIAIDDYRQTALVADAASFGDSDTASPQVGRFSVDNHATLAPLDFGELSPVTITGRDGKPTEAEIIPVGLDLDSRHRMGITINTTSNTVTVFDTEAEEVTDDNVLPVGDHPFSVDIDERSGKAYVGYNGDGKLGVVDLLNNKVTKTINVGGSPTKIDIDEKRNRIYVGNSQQSYVTVVNLKTGKVTNRIPTGANSRPVLDDATGKLWVSSVGDQSVSVIDPKTNRTLTTIKTTGGSNQLAIDPVKELVYSADLFANAVSVIDQRTNKVVQVVPTGERTIGVAVNPSTGLAYATAADGKDVTAINVIRPAD